MKQYDEFILNALKGDKKYIEQVTVSSNKENHYQTKVIWQETNNVPTGLNFIDLEVVRYNLRRHDIDYHNMDIDELAAAMREKELI